jgi:hypothetical protein
MSNFSTGVETIIKRMETNPEEFFNEADKWRFMFKEKFREVLTEREKSAIHEALTAVRRKEFDYCAMQTLLNTEMQEQMRGTISGAYSNAVTTGTGAYITASNGINQVQPKESETLTYKAKDRYILK